MARKEYIKALIPKVNTVSERFGVRIQPVHYYSEVPDRRWLARHESLWARPVKLAGVSWDLDAQLKWLSQATRDHLDDVPALSEWEGGLGFGPGYGPIEGQVLRCIVRQRQPSKIVEVGSGMSTVISLRARDTNVKEGGRRTEIVCVEPYPSEALKRLDVQVIEKLAQAVPNEVFTTLSPGDILFIDSSHAVHAGSDVIRLYLEVLPFLPPGVLIHIHDVYLPYLYSPSILWSIFDWQETALLAALLTNNSHLRVRCCLSALCHERTEQLRQVLPSYRPEHFTNGLGLRNPNLHFPSSAWLETC